MPVELNDELDRLEVARLGDLASAPVTSLIVPDTAAGLAATIDGQYFSVPSADPAEYMTLYRNNAGVAEDTLKRYPSSAAVIANSDRLDSIQERKNAINFNDTPFSILISSITNPLTRYNSTVNPDGSIAITQLTTNLLLIGPVLQDNALANKLIEVRGSITGAGSNAGLAICINPSSATEMDPVNHVSIVWRANGTLTAYRADGLTVASSITFDPTTAVLPPAAWSSGDDLRMTMLMRDDPSNAVLSLFLNGAKVAEYAVAGLPTGFVGVVQRNNTNNTSTATLRISKTYVNSIPRAFYINGAAGPGGNGTEEYPYQTLSDAISRVDEVAGELSIYLKPGVYRGSIQIRGDRRRRVRIIGQPCSETIIRASTLRNSGWSKTAGYSNIWERSHQFAGVLASNSGNGGVIDTTNATAKLPFTIYTRNSPNSSLAALDGQPGRYLVNTVDRKIYVHALGSVDPNTISLEVSDQQYAVAILRAGAGANYWCNVELQNIRAEYAYSHNFAMQRVKLLADNCIGVGSSVANGFGIDDCIGQIYGCIGHGNNNDGFNAAGGGVVPADSHALWMYDCVSRYNVVGDGMSNHDGIWHVYGGAFHDNGKDGIVATGKAYLRNVHAYMNTQSNIQLYPAAANAIDSYMRADNCVVGGGIRGFHLNSGGVGLKATMDIYGGIASGASGSALYVFNTSGTASDFVMNAYNVTDGGGNSALKVNTGGTLNTFAPTVIV